MKELDPDVTPLLPIVTPPTVREVTVMLLLLSIFPRSSVSTTRFLLIIVVMMTLSVNWKYPVIRARPCIDDVDEKVSFPLGIVRAVGPEMVL